MSFPWSPESWSWPRPRAAYLSRAAAEHVVASTPTEQVVPAPPMDDVIPRGADQDVSLGRAHQRGPAPVAEHHRQELHRANVAAPFLGSQDAALILAEWLALGVAAVAGAPVAGRAAGYQGMGQGGAAMVGERGVEDVREQDAGRGDNVRSAREEARDPGGAIHAKQVVIVDNGCLSGADNLRPVESVVARHQRPGEGQGAAVGDAAAAVSEEFLVMVLFVTVRVPLLP